MSKNNKTLDPNAPLRELAGHKRPMTRRELLGRGFITGGAMLTAPSIFRMMHSEAYAQQVFSCNVQSGGGKIPFLCIDLGGGANIAGSNVLIGGPGGPMDFLDVGGYERLGLPPNLQPNQPNQISTDLGVPMHADSAFLAGITSKTSQTTRDNTNGAIIAARSENDTQNNPHNPIYGINKAGADGNLVTLIGSRNSESGGRSVAPMSMIDPEKRPTKISSGNDATGLVDTGKLTELLDANSAAAVMATTEGISDAKINKLAEDPNLLNFVHCGYEESANLVATFGDPTVLDPMNDTDINGGIFSANELDESRFEKTASVMKLVVEGYAGAGVIEQGGYDYHNDTRSTGETRDFLAGQMMGACLEFAALRNQQLMLYVFTDGSLASDGVIDNSAEGRGKGRWVGDNSSTASVFFLVYDPAGRPQLRTPTSGQIGYFRPGGSVETAANRVANNVNLLAEAIVLNFMALHDETGMFGNVLPNHGLGAGAELDSLIAFAPIRTPPA